MQIADRLMLRGIEVTGEGFLVATATIARSRLQGCWAFELGPTHGDPDRFAVCSPPRDKQNLFQIKMEGLNRTARRKLRRHPCV